MRLDALWRAGQMKAFRVCGTVNRMAWRIIAFDNLLVAGPPRQGWAARLRLPRSSRRGVVRAISNRKLRRIRLPKQRFQARHRRSRRGCNYSYRQKKYYVVIAPVFDRCIERHSIGARIALVLVVKACRVLRNKFLEL